MCENRNGEGLRGEGEQTIGFTLFDANIHIEYKYICIYRTYIKNITVLKTE